MLVLTRRVGEGIAIGDDVKIVVMQIKGKQVRLGIKAGASTAVHREEIFQKIQEENQRAGMSSPEHLDGAVDTLRKVSGDFSAGTVPVRRLRRTEG